MVLPKNVQYSSVESGSYACYLVCLEQARLAFENSEEHCSQGAELAGSVSALSPHASAARAPPVTALPSKLVISCYRERGHKMPALLVLCPYPPVRDGIAEYSRLVVVIILPRGFSFKKLA